MRTSIDCELLRQSPDSSRSVNDRPTLLFVHGATGSAWEWTVHWFEKCVQRGWPCAAISLRGHGNSAGADHLHRWTLGDYERDVRAAFDRIREQNGIPPILVGHSMGTLIVQRCLHRRAAPRAVLLAPVGVAGSWYVLWRMLCHNPCDLFRVLFALGRSPIRKKWYLFSDDMDDALAKQYQRKGWKESIRARARMLLPAKIEPVNIPVLVLGAGEDRLVSAAALKQTAAFYDTAPFVVDQLAHHMMLDTRWDRPLEVMLDWLDRA